MGTDVRKFFEKDFLGSWNVEGGDLVLTITKCVQGELNNPGTSKKTKKPVVYFRETDKGLALNATNTKTIAGLYGYIVEEWPGKRIALFKSMTRSPAGGDDVECLRVRPKAPATGVEAKPQEPVAYITPEQVISIETRCMDAGISLDKLKAALDVTALAMIPAEMYDKVQKRIDKTIDAKQATT